MNDVENEYKGNRRMINREDMLELTRRMTSSRNCFTRIAGSYMDEEGYSDGTFNTNFLKLSGSEKEKNLAIAKTIPFSETNVQLKEYSFPGKNSTSANMWRLLKEMKSCELKNDALLETFYEIVGEHYHTDYEYAVYLFYGIYDIPIKASDKARLDESEEVYQFLICAICPVSGDYEPGSPECGFLFPLFSDRSSDENHIAVFDLEAGKAHEELTKQILGCNL